MAVAQVSPPPPSRNSAPPGAVGRAYVPLIAGTASSGNTDLALDLYGQITGLTVLRGAVLPELAKPFNPGTDTNQTRSVIEREFAENNVLLLPKGGAFVLAVPAAFTNSSASSWINLIPEPKSSEAEIMPSSTVNFIGATPEMVLQIYAEASGRNLLRPLILGFTSIKLRNQAPLSRGQVLYAFKVVLALNGLAVVEDGERFVQVASMGELERIHPGAPKRKEGERLMDPKKIPVFAMTPKAVRPPPPVSTNATWSIGQLYDSAAKLVLKARMKLGYKPPSPPKPIAHDLAAYYARLRGRSLLSSKLDGTSVVFEVRTPITRAELLYGIETTFELNNLALIAPEGTNSVQVGHISQKERTAPKR